jgi:hypothetical protein
MKFLFADSFDQIDPGYNFIEDTYSPNRQIGTTDQYPHEYFGERSQKSYDGMLLSYANVYGKGKRFSDGQALRLRNEGVQKFLRFKSHATEAPIMGDCGAFAYANEKTPPFSPEEVAQFYHDCGFTHGVSVDHIIFSFSENNHIQPSDEERERYQITLNNAERFIETVTKMNYLFTPIASIQGWNPTSMAEMAKQFVAMGYNYLAVGGLVPLKVSQIHSIVSAIREVTPDCNLHLLGFAKPANIEEFLKYKITSFDSTSPLIRAFKDSRRNYWTDDYQYSAIRVPQWGKNRTLQRRIKAGQIDQDVAKENETWSLQHVRDIAAFDSEPSPEEITIALEEILQYNALIDGKDDKFLSGKHPTHDTSNNLTNNIGWQFKWNETRAQEYTKTLLARPWMHCPCRVCQEAGVEVIIFRGSNRNRRRGFHNLWWFYNHLQKILNPGPAS